MLDRRRSLQQILRARRPATTSAKQRIRSVRKNMKGAASHASVAIDSFVEDSQDSLPQYSVRKPGRRAQTDASRVCGDLPESAVDDVDDEEDKYNLLESTEEIELPCRDQSADQITVCAELDADLTNVTELSHTISDFNASVAAAVVCEQSTLVHNPPVSAAPCGIQTPQPLPTPVQPLPPPVQSLPPPVLSELDTTEAVDEERGTTHSRPHRLSSLPTQQLDGQLDTPAAATRKRSSVVDKVRVKLFIIIVTIVGGIA